MPKVRRHIATLMLTLVLVVLSVIFRSHLTVDLLPSITNTHIGVRIEAPGLAPEVAVIKVTQPLEQAFATTDGVLQVFSRTREGQVSLDLFFRPEANIDQALNAANDTLNQVKRTLPDSVQEPRLFKVDSLLPIYEFELTAPSLHSLDVQTFAVNELATELGLVPGVGTVDVSGAVREEVRINVDLPRLQASGVGLSTVLASLKNRNQDTAGGRIWGLDSEPLIRTIGHFQTVDEISNLPFPVTGADHVYLRDFATVVDGMEKQQVYTYLNGEEAIKFSIQKQPNAKTMSVVKGVKKHLQSVTKAGVKLTTTWDESRFIHQSFTNITMAVAGGLICVAIALTWCLNSWRSALLVLLPVPLVVLGTIIALGLFGATLNLFTLGGLILGVVLVVNYSLLSSERGAVAGGSALLGAVLPFLLIGGLISRLFHELILSICIAVPMALTTVHQVRQTTKGCGNFLARVWPWRYGAVALSLLVWAVISLWVLPQVPLDFFPQLSPERVILLAQFPPDTTLETNQRVMGAVDGIFRHQPSTKFTVSTVGGYLFGNTTTANPLRSSTLITLKEGTDVGSYIQGVSQELQGLNLVDIHLDLIPVSLRGLNNSLFRGDDLDLILQGSNAQILHQVGEQVLATLESEVSLASFHLPADAPQSEIQVLPNWERVAALGLTAGEIGQTIQTAITGSVPTQLLRGNQLVDVRVQLDERAVAAASQLGSLPLFVQEHRQVRLSDVAKVVEGEAPTEIQRLNQEQVFLLSGNLNPYASFSRALDQINGVLPDLDLPADVTVLPVPPLPGELLLVAGLALFLVFVVLAVEANSLVEPLVVLFTLPLVVAGGILAIYITHITMGVMAIAGLVLLTAIFLPQAIVMVKLAQQIQVQQQVSPQVAIFQAAPQCERSVLVVAIVTMVGMFPFALGLGSGAAFLQPLGVVVFSGLPWTTVVTLVMVPCFYSLCRR